MEPEISENKIHQFILERISNSEEAMTHLSQMIQNANIIRFLLNLKSFESATFKINKSRFKLLSEPEIHRLTLVYPMSYSFDLKLEVSGFYKIKYRNIQHALPQPVEPFKLLYTGIIVFQDSAATFKNEKIDLI